MFTGIVEMTGTVEKRLPDKLFVCPSRPFADPVPGESVAVNGCCLTLEKMENGILRFHTLAETLSRTNLASARVVNMERAMSAAGRFGGHFVSGHIDAVSAIVSRRRRTDGDVELTVEIPDGFNRYFVPKGSVAIDGISLTLAEVEKKFFRVCLIPTTLSETVLEERCRKGEKVNIECDMLAKIVARQWDWAREEERDSGKSRIEWKTLEENGFL